MKEQLQAISEKFSVLIIEDNLGDFVLIEDYLLETFKQISIVHCTDYESSINYLKEPKEEVSIILLDLHLPDMKGNELINSLLAYNFQIPIIILTGYSDLAMAKSSLQIGVYDFLVKDEINPAIIYKTIIFAINRGRFVHQIEDEKRNYENLFNFNPQPTWLLDAKSLKILNANIAAQKKYGLSLSDFQEMSFTELHPLDEKQLIQDKLISKENGFTGKHFTHILNNGEDFNVDVYFREIKSISRVELIVQAYDISETLKHINTIENQNAKLRDIAWTQSHVVRAPLSRILGIVNLLEEHKENFEEISFWLKQLKASANEMDIIVNRIVHDTNKME
jgi:FixJ family two-component response regulator